MCRTYGSDHVLVDTFLDGRRIVGRRVPVDTHHTDTSGSRVNQFFEGGTGFGRTHGGQSSGFGNDKKMKFRAVTGCSVIGIYILVHKRVVLLGDTELLQVTGRREDIHLVEDKGLTDLVSCKDET